MYSGNSAMVPVGFHWDEAAQFNICSLLQFLECGDTDFDNQDNDEGRECNGDHDG